MHAKIDGLSNVINLPILLCCYCGYFGLAQAKVLENHTSSCELCLYNGACHTEDIFIIEDTCCGLKDRFFFREVEHTSCFGRIT